MRVNVYLVIILLLLSACSSKPTLELVKSTVEIKEVSYVGFFSNGEVAKLPYIMSYNFRLENTGQNMVGGLGKLMDSNSEEGLKVTLEPSEKLIALSNEIFGVNVFEDGGRKFGSGETIVPILVPHQHSDFTIDFVLMEISENAEIKVPTFEQAEKLKSAAMDATLVVAMKNKEIGRFDLKNATKN